MMNGFDIYVDGVLKKQCETDSFIIVALEGDSMSCIRRNPQKATDLVKLYNALIRVATDLGGDVTDIVNHIDCFIEAIAEEDSSEEEEHMEVEGSERVEMTPEVIEAITKQEKKQANKPDSSKTAKRKALTKKLSALAKTLKDRV